MLHPAINSYVRGFIFDLIVIIWTAILGLIALPLLLGPRRIVMRAAGFWARTTLILLRVVVGLDYEIRGLHRLPGGRCIVAMKHQSAWDALILPVILRDPAIVVKRELCRLPLCGLYLARAGLIVIDRKARASAVKMMISAASAPAAHGRPIVIFPEGTRTMPGTRHRYQSGVAALYQALGLPVVPVALNSGLYWGRGSCSKRSGRVVLEILDPILPGQSRSCFMLKLENRIEAATMALEYEANGVVT